MLGHFAAIRGAVHDVVLRTFTHLPCLNFIAKTTQYTPCLVFELIHFIRHTGCGRRFGLFIYGSSRIRFCSQSINRLFTQHHVAAIACDFAIKARLSFDEIRDTLIFAAADLTIFLVGIEPSESVALEQHFDGGRLLRYRADINAGLVAKKFFDLANAFASSFLMPSSSVLNQSMAGAGVERILAARSFWKVSAMAMTHRLNELHLLSDWQYRSTCITLSERGYRRSEPGGIVPETSQLLRKVLYGAGARLRVRDVAAELDVEPAEVREYVRHLVPLSA